MKLLRTVFSEFVHFILQPVSQSPKLDRLVKIYGVTMSRVSFDRIVRFQNGSGQTMYGEVPMDFDGDKFVGLSVEVYEGEAPWDQTFKKTSKKETIQKVWRVALKPP